MWWLSLCIAGCLSSPESVKKAEADPVAEVPVVPDQVVEHDQPVPEGSVQGAAVAASTSDPVPVVLVWEGISPLHQSFFSDVGAVEQLGRDLALSVEPPANVYVSFDSHRHIGRILLRLLPGTGKGLVGAGNEPPKGVSPVLQALARYRDAVASRYDTRVAAFHIGLDSYRGTTHCRFGAAGPLPPDGTVVDACVLLNGQPVCGIPTSGGRLEFAPEAVTRLEQCLR